MVAPSFADAGELESWLAAHGIPTAEYGCPGAKSIQSLLEEVLGVTQVRKGESTLRLEGGAPVRSVAVLSLAITDDEGRVLIETRQRLPDGQERRRGLPVSEKLLPGEGWREAAERAVAEELGSALPAGWRTQLQLLEGTHSVAVQRLESPSYPGLATVYETHSARAHLPCLPSEPFQTQEAVGGGTLEAWWEWQQAPAGGTSNSAGSGSEAG